MGERIEKHSHLNEIDQKKKGTDRLEGKKGKN
jgi:hypothetical protein